MAVESSGRRHTCRPPARDFRLRDADSPDTVVRQVMRCNTFPCTTTKESLTSARPHDGAAFEGVLVGMRPRPEFGPALDGGDPVGCRSRHRRGYQMVTGLRFVAGGDGPGQHHRRVKPDHAERREHGHGQRVGPSRGGCDAGDENGSGDRGPRVTSRGWRRCGRGPRSRPAGFPRSCIAPR